MGERKPWFHRRGYGQGWYPATIEGWLVIVIWLLVIIGDTMVLLAAQLHTTNTTQIALFLAIWGVIAAADTAALFILSRRKLEPDWLPGRRKW